MAQAWNEPSHSASEDEEDSVETHRDKRCKYATNEMISKWREDENGRQVFLLRHLVRVCYCGKFPDRRYLLNTYGQNMDGYEIHYGHCSWRRYTEGGKKFWLVRVCKCGRYTDGEGTNGWNST
ncbi:hypothetical protein Bbelb_171850 [Branchiostoma belcheri]|nr:hypothetical protein Bbelb_171850 [Branchiostoma belcheri]